MTSKVKSFILESLASEKKINPQKRNKKLGSKFKRKG